MQENNNNKFSIDLSELNIEVVNPLPIGIVEKVMIKDIHLDKEYFTKEELKKDEDNRNFISALVVTICNSEKGNSYKESKFGFYGKNIDFELNDKFTEKSMKRDIAQLRALASVVIKKPLTAVIGGNTVKEVYDNTYDLVYNAIKSTLDEREEKKISVFYNLKTVYDNGNRISLPKLNFIEEYKPNTKCNLSINPTYDNITPTFNKPKTNDGASDIYGIL